MPCNSSPPKIKSGPKLSQEKINKIPKLSPQRIAAIAKKVEKGEVQLPDLDLPSDADYVAIWSLVDSGSSVNVVDATKLFPKSKVHPPPPGHKGFTVANGVRIPHRGFVHTEIQTVEGEKYVVRWKNAAVSMPILSTHAMARNTKRLEYDEDEGIIRDKLTGKTTKFYQAGSVYFVPLLIKKSLLPEKMSQDFGRPG